jgi:pimeloyl-ACP methyl ester carboxylesterase
MNSKSTNVQERGKDYILASLQGSAPPAPDWFEKMLSVPMERDFIKVAGLSIETAHWGTKGAPGLLFIHGNGANLDWWRFIAPFFAETYRVAAFSFSGMGNSDWNAPYNSVAYCDQAMAAARHCGLFESAHKPIVVGHSLGGAIATLLARSQGVHLGGAVVIDAHIQPNHHWGLGREASSIRYSATEVEMLARFRFAPPQPCDNLYIADLLARAAYRDVPGKGWAWKHDPAIIGRFDFDDVWTALGQAACPIGLIRGGESWLTGEGKFEAAHRHAPPGTEAIVIPGAHHHVMVDEPLALVEALKTFLAIFREQAAGD